MVNGSIIERTEKLAAELQCSAGEEKSALVRNIGRLRECN